MSIPGSAEPLLLAQQDATATGYQIQRSLRFNSSDSAYLSRTPASAGNRNTWTWAGWVKRSAFGNNYTLFSSTTDSYDLSYNQIQFEAGNKIRLKFADGGATTLDLTTNAVFRDASAWYHILIAVDTTQSAQQSRVSIYINGALQALTGTYPGQNANTIFNKASASHHLAGSPPFSEYFSGYLADIHFIDGQALTPSSFAETNATTGQWVPKAYTGSYGTNGFQLKFADNSNNTATTLGKDTSGNGNNWTPNNLSVTAGAGNDSLVDTPTSYGTDTGAGGEVRGNYATLNPLDKGSSITLSNGNLDYSQTNTAAYETAKATFAMGAGKWYWEVLITNRSDTFFSRLGIGILTTSDLNNNYVGSSASGYSYFGDANNVANANKVNNNSFTSLGTGGFTTGDVLMFAFDNTNGNLWFGKNGTWLLSGNPATGANPIFSSIPYKEYLPAVSTFSSNSATAACSLNAGARPFAYTAPSGFKALCDTNLPAPVVAKPNQHFDVVLRNGGAGSYTTTVNMSNGALLWDKPRNQASGHYLFDSLRGISKNLRTDSTQAEATDATWITSFNSNSFTTGSSDWGGGVSIVDWIWAAGSQVTNTQGSITSQVRANASAGFSIVTYTGTGSTATVGHGLGVAPSLMIHKARNLADFWLVYHGSLGAGTQLSLSSTSAKAASTKWNNTAPTSTVFTVTNDGAIGQNGINYVTYCFAPVAGYSSSFSITGNGSIGGPFCFLGFRPRLILLKRTDTTANWLLLDTAREGYNVDNDPLWPNLSNAEGITDLLDITSNGFKVRSTDAEINANTGTYVGFAWAEYPFQYARAR